MTVYLLPPVGQLEDLDLGDSYATPVLGAAKVKNGKFNVRLDPDSAALIDGVNELEIVHTASDSSVGGIAAGQLVVTRNGKGRTFTAIDVGELSVSDEQSGGSVEEGNDLPEIMNPGAGNRESDRLDNYGCFDTVIGQHQVPYTALVTGTNTSAIKVSAGVGQNSTATTGWAIKFEGGGWIEASGKKTVTNTNGVTIEWPASNAYGTYSYRPILNVYHIDHWCYDGWNNYRKLVPVGFTGGWRAPSKWTNAAYPTHCTPTDGPATFRKTWSTSTNWSGGLKLSWSGVTSFNVDSRSGYTSNAWVQLESTSNGRRWLCGRNDVPGGHPGYIMGDWKDR